MAIVGGWVDRPHVDVVHPPTFVPTSKPWEAVVEISRRGRRLDGFRPVVEIHGADSPRTFNGKPIGVGRYRVQVVFPHPGAYTYTVVVADHVAARGTIFAIPQ